jgi:hypothetical protein
VNKKQRTVLIIGAGVLLYVLFTSPKISIVKGTYVTPSPDKKGIAKIVVDVSTAITKAVAVLGATLLISIALKDKKGTRNNLQWTETLLLAAVKRDRLRWMPLPKSLDF